MNEQVTARKLHEWAKTRTMRDLREMFPAQYRLLMEANLAELREQYGWTDQRPEANRKMWAERKGRA